MLLNLLRLEGVDPERLMKRSFHQFQSDRELPVYRRKLEAIQSQIKRIKVLLAD
jgi:ATP-dependent RNA helicase DOB1